MEKIIPLGVPRSFSSDPSVSSTGVRFKAKTEESSKQVHQDFPDPRLFDFDDNGTVDANDVIQEHQTRRETLETVSAKTPLAKYVVQLQEAKEDVSSEEPVPQPSALPPKISIFV